jgi:hypothetical protein
MVTKVIRILFLAAALTTIGASTAWAISESGCLSLGGGISDGLCFIPCPTCDRGFLSVKID